MKQNKPFIKIEKKKQTIPQTHGMRVKIRKIPIGTSICLPEENLQRLMRLDVLVETSIFLN